MSVDKNVLRSLNSRLFSYYESLESKIGYRVVLGGARHHGYYEKGEFFSFRTSKQLRRMEDEVGRELRLKKDSLVLDAGCGSGYVAMRLASKFGYRVQAIDIMDHHLLEARQNVTIRAYLGSDYWRYVIVRAEKPLR